MIVQIYGLNLLPGASELLSQCVDDLDENDRAPIESSWQDILQTLWRLSQNMGDDIRAGIESLMHQRLEGVDIGYFWELQELDWKNVGESAELPLDPEGDYNTNGDCHYVSESELLSWLWLFASLSAPGARILGVREECNDTVEDLGADEDEMFVHASAVALQRSGSTAFEEMSCRVVDMVRDGEVSVPLAEWIGEPCPDRVRYMTGNFNPVSGKYGWVDYDACVGQRVSIRPPQLLKSPRFVEKLNAALTEAACYFERAETAFPWHLQAVNGRLVLVDTHFHSSSCVDSLKDDRDRAKHFGVILPRRTMSTTPLDKEQCLRLARMVGEASDVGSRALVKMEAMIAHKGSCKVNYSIAGRMYAVERRSDGVRVHCVDQEVQVHDGKSWILDREWVEGAQTGNHAVGNSH